MRRTRMLAASLLIVLGAGHGATSSAVSDEPLKGSIIRRHPLQDTSEVHLSATGEMSIMQRQDPVNDYCDHSFILGTPNSNTCTKGAPITHPETCEHAARNVTGLRLAPPKEFVVHNGWKSPLSFPKNCFVDDGVVYFNPTEPSPSVWKGTPLCQRELYPSAKQDYNSAAVSTITCPVDFEAITTYSDCMKASACNEGVNGCKMPDFVNAAPFESQKRPKGCYREADGCFNFNHIKGTPTETVVGQAVCQLVKA